MSEEENIKRPQPTDDPQGAEGGQQPEEDAVNSITEDKSLLTDNIAGDAEQQSEIKNQKSEIETMEVHHHAHDPAAPHHKKKLEIIFLGIFNVISGCVLRFFSGVSTGACNRTSTGKRIRQSPVYRVAG
jgi:hypothetical protein